ncbi:hypothetical protein L208DRAFT_1382073 [Tricholoma matsutake]|nr:hypothetical protein L208DRAFT_1382073 [Tricholoma matsutake 945]
MQGPSRVPAAARCHHVHYPGDMTADTIGDDFDVDTLKSMCVGEPFKLTPSPPHAQCHPISTPAIKHNVFFVPSSQNVLPVLPKPTTLYLQSSQGAGLEICSAKTCCKPFKELPNYKDLLDTFSSLQTMDYNGVTLQQYTALELTNQCFDMIFALFGNCVNEDVFEKHLHFSEDDLLGMMKAHTYNSLLKIPPMSMLQSGNRRGNRSART